MKIFAVTMLAVVLLAVSPGVWADPVPAAIQKSLKPFTITKTTLSDGVLRIVMNHPTVTDEMFKAAGVEAVCMPLWMDQKAWGTARIDRVEVLNSIGRQGFALEGGRTTCGTLGKLSTSDSAKFIVDKAIRCVAGVCQKR